MDGFQQQQDMDSDYWQALIDEGEAAGFIDQSKRTLQGHRYRGGVKYRRIDLRRWAEARLRSSTSDDGPGAVHTTGDSWYVTRL